MRTMDNTTSDTLPMTDGRIAAIQGNTIEDEMVGHNYGLVTYPYKRPSYGQRQRVVLAVMEGVVGGAGIATCFAILATFGTWQCVVAGGGLALIGAIITWRYHDYDRL
jgi:hypothetical protein